MKLTSALTFLATPPAWLPLYLALTTVVILRLFSRMRQLPLSTALLNSLHGGVMVAAWLCPLPYRPLLGWLAVWLVAAMLYMLLFEKRAPIQA